MLPDTYYRPSCSFEIAVSLPIAFYIALQFIGPPLGVLLSRPQVLRAGVPVTSIDKDGDMYAGKYQIDPTPTRDDGPVNEIAATAPVELSTH